MFALRPAGLAVQESPPRRQQDFWQESFQFSRSTGRLTMGFYCCFISLRINRKQ